LFTMLTEIQLPVSLTRSVSSHLYLAFKKVKICKKLRGNPLQNLILKKVKSFSLLHSKNLQSINETCQKNQKDQKNHDN
jgi:hypothetical protein